MAPRWSSNTALANPKPWAQDTTQQTMLQSPPLPAELSPSLCRFVPPGSKGKKCPGCSQPHHLHPHPTGWFGEQQSSPSPTLMGLRQCGSDTRPAPQHPGSSPLGNARNARPAEHCSWPGAVRPWGQGTDGARSPSPRNPNLPSTTTASQQESQASRAGRG